LNICTIKNIIIVKYFYNLK